MKVDRFLERRLESLLYNVQETCKVLGVGSRTLYDLMEEHELYRPCHGLGEGLRAGARLRVYHREQVRLMALVAAGALTPDQAMDKWRIFQARGGSYDQPIVVKRRRVAS